jgi:uracil-DNA glycosylase
MQVSSVVDCVTFPCADVDHGRYLVPGIQVSPEQVSIVLISEAPPVDPCDDYYATGDPLFARTTIQAFTEAGATVSSVQDILDLGVYLTTAIKCGKIGYGIVSMTIGACSMLLERELGLFPHAVAYLLMGDVAIKAVNQISRRAGRGRAIPACSTYKIRGGKYELNGVRLFPSYVQAGPSFFIVESKRRMIAEDIATALRFAMISQQGQRREPPDHGPREPTGVQRSDSSARAAVRMGRSSNQLWWRPRSLSHRGTVPGWGDRWPYPRPTRTG